jgi:hypothetical protein
LLCRNVRVETRDVAKDKRVDGVAELVPPY